MIVDTVVLLLALLIVSYSNTPRNKTGTNRLNCPLFDDWILLGSSPLGDGYESQPYHEHVSTLRQSNMHHGWKILRLQMMFDVPSYKPPFLVIFQHFPTFSHDFPTFSHGFHVETSIFHRDSLAEWPGQLHASPSRRPRQPPSTASACPSLWLWGMSAWDPRFLGEISRVQTNIINNYVLLLGHRTWGIYWNI